MRCAWLALVLFITAPLALADDSLDADFPRTTIVIEGASRACYRFDVHLALNDAQRRRGLMFVRNMDPFAGMLFVYSNADYHSMWMKNTFIPLDMLFIHGDGVISSIVRDTEPQSLRSIRSEEPVQLVLELNAGVTKQLDIVAGGRVWWAVDADKSAASEH